MGLLARLRNFYKVPGSLFYGILKPCYRCVYGKSSEPIYIVSGMSKQIKVVINLRRKTYAVRGCLGIDRCTQCLTDHVPLSLPCKWIEI